MVLNLDLAALLHKQPPVHLLHIGKTGGSAVKHALEPYVSRRRPLLLHKHAFRLEDVPVGEQVFFFLRDPLKRFVSGFYSRQRQGRPRYNYPWSEAEARAFQRFTTPDELGRALSDVRATVSGEAREAMNVIQHVRDRYGYWLGSKEQLLARRADILMVGYQESLAADLERLKALLRLPRSVRLPAGEAAHRNPDGVDRGLSAEAKANLESWYAEDRMLLAWIKAGGLEDKRPPGL